MTTRIEAAEVARMMRTILKSEFSATRFTVKTRRTSSISVKWVDGPTETQVKEKIGHMHGASFDGMEDLKSYHDTTLQTPEGPKVVHFGNDYLFTSRDYSPVFLQGIADTCAQEWGRPAPEILCSESGHAYIRDDGVCVSTPWNYDWTMRSIILRTANETPAS